MATIRIGMKPIEVYLDEDGTDSAVLIDRGRRLVIDLMDLLEASAFSTFELVDRSNEADDDEEDEEEDGDG